jgi:hypothetical protein
MNARATAAAALALLAGCGYDITTQDLAQGGGAVTTYHAPDLSFAPGTTFAYLDGLGVVKDDAVPATQASPQVVSTVVAALEARGFVSAGPVDPTSPPSAPVDADLVVNLTALEVTTGKGSFWTTAPGHLGPPAFGISGADWSYGWSWVAWPATPPTLAIEVGDLRAGTAGAVPVVWAATVLAAGGAGYETAAMLDGIGQAFAQSPQLDTGGAP